MRLFVAVDISDELRERIAPVLSQAAKIPGLKAVERENLHITLLFLGEVAERRVAAIEEELSKVAFEPFTIRLRGVGAFPSPASPRVVWVGVDDAGELRKLADDVYAKLRKLGFKRDKEFSAHVTVARVKRRNEDVKRLIESFANEDFGEMVVESFSLKRSILRPQGPIYKDVAVFRAWR